MSKKVTLELTPLEANVTYAAVTSWWESRGEETLDFLGSPARVQALYRVFDKLVKIHS